MLIKLSNVIKPMVDPTLNTPVTPALVGTQYRFTHRYYILRRMLVTGLVSWMSVVWFQKIIAEFSS